MLPDWSIKHVNYYLHLALDLAMATETLRQRCFSRTIGALLVKNDNIIATGFNGPPRGIPTCDSWSGNWKAEGARKDVLFLEKKKCPRYELNYQSGQGLHLCPAVHAERNTLLMCAKNGISTDKGILYLTCGVPCKDCMVEIIQAGIQGIFCADDKIYDNLSWRLSQKARLPVMYYNGKLKKLVDGKFVTVEG